MWTSLSGAVLTALISTSSASPTSTSTATEPTPVEAARTFFWGNSTVSHSGQPSSTPRTNISAWMKDLAAAAEVRGCEEGHSAPKLMPSMLSDDIYPEPAKLEMSMELARPCGAKTWAEGEFDVGVLLDNNFGALDPNSGWGDIEGAKRRILAATKVEPKLRRWFLYSCQHDLDENRYTLAQWKKEHQRAYLDAFHELQDRLNASGLPAPVRLIPVGTLLLDLFREGGLLADMEEEAIFLDDAPHQSESTALVMAAVTFAAIYRRPVPESYTPPETVDARIRERWPKVRRFIWERMLKTDLAPRVFGIAGRGEPPTYPPVSEAARTAAAPKKLFSCRCAHPKRSSALQFAPLLMLALWVGARRRGAARARARLRERGAPRARRWRRGTTPRRRG